MVKPLEKSWKQFVEATHPPPHNIDIIKECFMTGAHVAVSLIQKDPKNFLLLVEEIKKQVKPDVLEAKAETSNGNTKTN